MTDQPRHTTPEQQARAGLAQVQQQLTEDDTLGRVFDDDLNALADAIPDRGNLLPGTLRAALQGENPLREAVSRLTTPVIAGGANWTGDEGASPAELFIVRRLAAILPDVAQSLALYGRAAVFPHYVAATDELPVMTVLRGTLYPVTGDSEQVERVLCFVPREGSLSTGLGYSVTEYAPGMVRLYPDTISPLSFSDRSPLSSAKQTHSPDRLPLAYRDFGPSRKGFRRGPGYHGLSAMRRYVARLAQENIVYHASAGPQRVVTGDPGGGGPLNVGPYKLIRLPLGADFKIVGPDIASLSQFSVSRKESAGAVLTAAGSPEGTVGAGDSGDARMIAAQMHEQTSTRLGNLCAEILTDAAELLRRMGVLSTRVEFTVRPSFPAKRTAEQANVISMLGAGVIDRYEALMRLQDAGIKISDDEVKRASDERDKLGADAPKQLAENLLGNAPAWVGLRALMIAYPELGITEEDVNRQRELDMQPAAPPAGPQG